MLSSLQEIRAKEGPDRGKVLLSWHSRMELRGAKGFREDFFGRVVQRAQEVNSYINLMYFIETYSLLAVTKQAEYATQPSTRSRWKT